MLAVVPATDRKRVIEAYQDVLHMTGDAVRGKQLFTRRCSQCHFYEGIGHRVGPELASVKDRSAASLLVRILDPNAAVESRYLEYRVELLDGRVFSGIIAEESSTSLTLIGPEEKRQAILRSDIESITSTRRTLMPEGFEKDLKPRDVADIIAFVGKPEPPRQFAGNAPAIVRAEAGGTLNLAAAQARIFGPRLIFEIKHQNLGWWAKPADRGMDVRGSGGRPMLESASITLARLSRPATCSCSKPPAASSAARRPAPEPETTSSRSADFGQLDLPAGQCELSMQSAGPIHGSLFDLRTIVLTPNNP